jgi:hypothetical protein
MRKTANNARYETLVTGEWVAVPKRGHRNACCDCGLAHRFEYRVVDGLIEFRAIVDRRATAAIRRPFLFKGDDT